MNTVKKLTLLTLTVLSIASCKKDKTTTTTTTAKTKTQLLTQKSWKLTNVRYKIDNGAWVDAYATVQSCAKDNILNYLTTSAYNVDEGATKCNTTDPQTLISGTWAFQNSETQLALTNTTFGTQVQSLLTLDENTLKSTETGSIGGGSTQTNEYTYGH
ncbi:MAG: hypothetical protein KA275_05980 [Chitinophagaceae bacterium]|jgi:hypothetical protein|nr:hypothetical protein [Chitinophagaceae bacterium]